MPATDSKASVPPSGAARRSHSSRAKWWISELISLAIVLAAVTAARSSLADHYYVPSGSMEYSLMDGDRVIVNKMSYGFRIPLTKIDIFGSSTPERGEIAVFDSPEDGTTRLIKRIVAIGGDRVSVVNGQLSINGEPLGDRHGRALRRARGAAESDDAAAQPGGGRTSRSSCRPAWCSRWATTAATATTAASSASSTSASCSAAPSRSTTAVGGEMRQGHVDALEAA